MSASAIGRTGNRTLRQFQPFGPPLLLGLLHVPYLFSYFSMLSRYDHYSFFPLAFLAAAYLIYDRLDRTRFRWGYLSSALVVLDVLLVAAAVVLRSPWPVWAGFLCGTTACCLAAKDKDYRGSLIHAVLPLLVLLRLPFAADLQLIGWLQTITTRLASKAMHQLSIVHFRAGNILELSDKSLLVEEACSGIQSLFAVIFVALVIVALKRRRLVHGLLLLPFAFLWAAACNVLRVLTIAVAWTHYDIDLSEGTAHTALGYVILTLATFLTFSSDQFLFCWTAPLPTVASRGFKKWIVALWNKVFAVHGLPQTETPEPLQPAPGWLRAWPVAAGVAGALFATQLAMGTGSKARTSVTSLETFHQGSLPAELGDWHQDSYSTSTRNAANSLGEFSNSWVYKAGTDKIAQVSCDHSFEGWHDLEVCYVGQGWVVEERSIVADDQWPGVEVVLSKPAGTHAYLVYSLFDTSGETVAPPRSSVSASFVNRVMRKAQLGGLNAAQTIQSQVFVELAEPVTADQRSDLIRRHRTVRELLRASYREAQ